MTSKQLSDCKEIQYLKKFKIAQVPTKPKSSEKLAIPLSQIIVKGYEKKI